MVDGKFFWEKIEMNSRDCYHVYAQQNKERGKSGNTSFCGRKAYSYAACIGNILDGGIILISAETYSVTTAKHISFLRSATSQYRQFTVLNTEPSSKEEHAANYRELIADYEREMKRVGKARKYVSLDHAIMLAEKANNYRQLFKLGNLKACPTPSPELVAELAAKESAVNKLAKEKLAKQFKEETTKFLAGEGFSVSVLSQLGREMLRVRQSYSGAPLLPTYVIETSKGAQFPLDQALRAYTLCCRIVERGEDWRENGLTIELGYYRVNSYVASSQTFIAGCHKVEFAEMQRVYNQIQDNLPQVLSDWKAGKLQTV